MPVLPEPALADDLTGTLNRRYLRELFASEWAGLVERHGRVALLVLDLDAFKPVNDRFGHLVGDAVLRAVSARLLRSFREDDRVVRYGGDEFVVVLPGAGAEEARALAERTRAALGEEDWIDPATGARVEHRVSFSIGVAAAPDDGGAGDDVLAAADRRLYEEKVRRQSSRRTRRTRWRLVRLAVALAAGAVATGGAFLLLRDPPAPDVGAVAPRSFAAADERVELETLRAEVARLKAELAADRTAEERASYQQRIRELEATLAEAERRMAAAAGAPAAAPETAPAPPDATAQALPAGAAAPEPGTRGSGRAAGAPAGAAPSPTVTPPVIVLPRLVSHAAPVYPPLALQRRIEASVDLRVTVDASGRVTAVEPVGPSRGLGFDEAALAAARSAVYRPGTRNGAPAAMVTTLQIRFVVDYPPSRR